MVIAVGTPENFNSFYILINDIKYPANSLIEAIDLCFKSFYALNADYSSDCKMVWQFLQKYVYNIPGKKNDSVATNVIAAWKNLNLP